MAVVEELGSQPGTHNSKRKIVTLTDIPKSLDRIANMDLDLQGYCKIKGQKLSKVDKQ